MCVMCSCGSSLSYGRNVLKLSRSIISTLDSPFPHILPLLSPSHSHAWKPDSRISRISRKRSRRQEEGESEKRFTRETKKEILFAKFASLCSGRSTHSGMRASLAHPTHLACTAYSVNGLMNGVTAAKKNLGEITVCFYVTH